ncbi:MAG: TonB-dependent receptor [Gammaproteobacteria bacterium]|nr:TonB-dependent receptor [Gammaproteobacteria bacterium]
MQQQKSEATNVNSIASTIPTALALLCLVFATGPLAAQDQDETTSEVSELDEALVEDSDEAVSDEEASESEAQSDETMEEMTVTGTRLPDGDPTALVHVYTAEDIALTGASTLDDFFRTVPQQFSSTNPQTSYITNTGDSLSGDSGGLYNRTDLGTVNLQGLGSGNTLILLNGRRIASYGGSERDIVNILGIPMSAIERVEVQLDGGSAVYGSDAIAGVVNFITKQGYRGMTANFKQEHSDSGSDLVTGGLTFGLTWGLFGSGDATVTLSKEEQEPIINSQLGFHTRDYRDLLGPEFDYRYFYASQPGIVYHWNGSSRYPGPYFSNYYIDGTWTQDPEKLYSYQLPSDHNGLGATVDDFKKGSRYSLDHIEPFDRIPYENGAHRSQEGIVYKINHILFERLRLFLDGRYTDNQSFRKLELPIMTVAVPASNAYNPFGMPMVVRYAPGLEQDNGLIPSPFQEGSSIEHDVTVGLSWKFWGNQTMEIEYTDSESESNQIYFSVPLTRERYAPGTEEYYRRLSSSDPDEAFNFFGNGTVQGSAITDFLGETSRRIGLNRTTSYQLLFKGYLWEFQGDEISYVIGTARTAKRYQTRYASNFGLTRYEFDYNLVWNGTVEPVIRNERHFFEVWIPIFSEAQAGWWGRSLQLTLKNTRTIDSQWGAVGGGYDFNADPIEVEAWSPETADWTLDSGFAYSYGRAEGLELTNYKEADDAPNVGLVYYPFDDLRMTFNFSRNIDPPLISQLYDTFDEFEWQTYDILDPYDPDGPTLHEIVPYRYSYANPDLKAAVAEKTSIRLVWNPSFLPGFRLDASMINNNFTGQVLHSRQLEQYPEALAFPQLAVRNERGDLIALNYDYFNRHLRKQTSGIVELRYRFSMATLGQIEAKVIHSKLLDNYDEPLPGLVLDYSGTIRFPDRYTTQVQLFWDRNKMTASLFARYIPPYLNDVAHYCTYQQKLEGLGRCAEFDPFDFLDSYIQLPVASLTVVDGTFTYRFSDKLEMRAGALNLFDRGPPLTVRGYYSWVTPYDPVRWNARGRVLSMGVTYKMGTSQ